MTEIDKLPPPRRRADRYEQADLVFLDIEAAGLAPGAWPIEIGLACILPSGGIVSDSELIRPDPTWQEDLWSPESAEVHRIPRQMLDTAPEATDVAAWTMERLAGRVAVSDAPEYDGRWLRTLLLTVETDPVVRIVDFDRLVAMAFDTARLRRVYHALDLLPTPHRAAPDAERLARAYLAGTGDRPVPEE